MSAWESFRAWPVWLRIPAFAVAAAFAVLIGYLLANSVFPASEDRPVASVESTTTEPNTTITTSTTTTVLLTTTVPATTTTRAVLVHLTNPLDIRAACSAVAVELMGHGVPEDATAEMVRLYQEQERAAQQPGATVRAPSLDAFCRTWIKERFPDDVKEYSYLKYATALDDLIRRSGPSSGSIPPGGICHHRSATGQDEYQAPSVSGSCPFGWELIR